jgi:hypothetical protein
MPPRHRIRSPQLASLDYERLLLHQLGRDWPDILPLQSSDQSARSHTILGALRLDIQVVAACAHLGIGRLALAFGVSPHLCVCAYRRGHHRHQLLHVHHRASRDWRLDDRVQDCVQDEMGFCRARRPHDRETSS